MNGGHRFDRLWEPKTDPMTTPYAPTDQPVSQLICLCLKLSVADMPTRG